MKIFSLCQNNRMSPICFLAPSQKPSTYRGRLFDELSLAFKNPDFEQAKNILAPSTSATVSDFLQALVEKTGEQALFEGLRSDYCLVDTGKTSRKAFADQNKKARKYIFKRDVFSIPIYAEQKANNNLYVPSAKEIALSLSLVPQKALGSIEKVKIYASYPSKDPRFLETKNAPYAEVIDGKTLAVYPQKENRGQTKLDAAMIHEGGHFISYHQFGNHMASPHWQMWDTIMRKDHLYPSIYGSSHANEDFSEALVLYILTKGTELEALFKENFRFRGQIFDQLFEASLA